MSFEPDVIVVGAGLAGLVATHELAKAGKHVLVIEQENRKNLGGQAFWSLGGLFFVDSPEQRRMKINDSLDLARQDWFGSAGFDSPDDEDFWGRQWAEAYLRWAAGGKRGYLHDLGLTSVPMVGWAERGDGSATGHGNSVPRFHITWGTGPRVVEIFADPVQEAEQAGLVRFAFRRQVDELIVEDGAVVGVRGSVLVDDDSDRGVKSSREVVATFEERAAAVVVTSGGIGHNHELMRKNWPTERVGPAPSHLISGVPAHVDGRMLAICEEAGGRIVNRDRMWAYTEGVHNWDPIWPDHAIRILPGPSSMWFDANGKRLTGMSGVPGADSIGAMTQILATGHDYSWFVLTQSIIEKEFALSGSEQNPDLTGRDVKFLLQSRLAKGAPGPVEAFKEHGEDFVVADTIDELVSKMNRIARGPKLDVSEIERQIVARDREVANDFTKDAQVMAIHNARKSLTDKIVRVAKPHRILDPEHGPLIAVRLNILSRKTLGGLQTNLDSQVIGADGEPIPGLYAAGEVAGFGGGGVHGHNALEGTFLGGCIFSGRAAGRALARRPVNRPVVMLHGSAGGRGTWSRLVEMLAAEGRNSHVCTYGRYGHGRFSPGHVYGVGDIPRSAQEVADFVDSVLAETGADKVDVVAHSVGALVAQYYLKRLGGAEKVDRMVGIAPTFHGTTFNGLLRVPGASKAAEWAVGENMSQQAAGSDLIRELYADGDTAPGVRYTVISPRRDAIVTPVTSQSLEGVETITLRGRANHISIPHDDEALRHAVDALLAE